MSKEIVTPADATGPAEATGPEQGPESQDQETLVPCEVYSRIVGYLRPVQNWNKGKKQEFAARRTYQVKEKAVK